MNPVKSLVFSVVGLALSLSTIPVQALPATPSPLISQSPDALIENTPEFSLQVSHWHSGYSILEIAPEKLKSLPIAELLRPPSLEMGSLLSTVDHTFHSKIRVISQESLTSVPEPTAWLFLTACLFFLMILRRRFRSHA